MCKIYLFLINVYIRDIYPLLMLVGSNNFLALSLKQKTRYMRYKYLLKYTSKRFIIFILKHTNTIFLQSIHFILKQEQTTLFLKFNAL